MGAQYQGPPLLQDLKLTFLSSSTLIPPQHCERRSMFLSNIDQVLNFNVETVHFFPVNPDFPTHLIIDKLKSALERLLEPYDFLAGRLRFNPLEDRLEIDCNGAGVDFVVASSELSLAEIGELEYPNPAFRQLALGSPPEALGLQDQPLLLLLQVTTFKCGGFSMGITNNHTTFDGLSFRNFLQNLASLAADKPLAVKPYTNRHLLASRSPPRVTFPHPELMKLPPTSPTLHGQREPIIQRSTLLDPTTQKVQFKLFRLTSKDISTLKQMARSDGGGGSPVTSFNVVTAHLWRCKALSTVGSDPEKPSSVLYAVDLRSRLQPPLPQSYTGNAVLSAYASSTCRELEVGPFARVVEVVREGAVRMDDEYARSVIDWGHTNKGIPRGDVLVSSWWRLGFSDVEYPWGKPSYSCPVAQPNRDIILLFPNIRGGEEGVNAHVALPDDDMEEFERLFYEFLG